MLTMPVAGGQADVAGIHREDGHRAAAGRRFVAAGEVERGLPGRIGIGQLRGHHHRAGRHIGAFAILAAQPDALVAGGAVVEVDLAGMAALGQRARRRAAARPASVPRRSARA